MALPIQIREDLQELARLAAAITAAHSCAIFLPTELLVQTPSRSLTSRSSRPLPHDPDATPLKQILEPGLDYKAASIDLVAVHSYSKLARDCRIQVGSGLLGWVADQGRPIHLAPFEIGSSSLGLYTDSEPIRSLVAVPIIISGEAPKSISGEVPQRCSSHACGVLMCDSLASDGFANTHVKLLEQLATHTARLIHWVQRVTQVHSVETSWDLFSEKIHALGDAIGPSSIEFLRIRVESFATLASSAGISTAVQVTEQFIRLAQQALPPHFPVVKVPNGDFLVAVDNMMSAFFQQKLQSLAHHLSAPRKPFSIIIDGFGAKLGPDGRCDIDAALQQQPLSRRTSSTAGGTRA